MLYENEPDLSAALKSLDEEKNAARRGRLFEDLVAGMFRANRFDVQKNPGAARPRQTDLLAGRGNQSYLIECKWRSAKADIDAVDSLRSRLRRTFGATGLMISMQGFSGAAISDVADRREQPILLLSGNELRSLIRSPSDRLLELLWEKREALLVDGKALVDEPTRRQRKATHPSLPESPIQFVLDSQEPTPVISFGGDFGKLTFAHELQDIDWVAAPGNGVTLDVSLPILSQDGILDLLSRLADLGWASPDACWSIQQMSTIWHGFGAAAFATELPRWQQRAETRKAHHSEEFCYVDNCPGGFYSLTSKISAEATRWAQETVLSFQLQGIPLDLNPLLQLCRSIGVHDEVYFRPRCKRSVSSMWVPDWMRSISETYALATTPSYLHERPMVCGIVIPNPLRDTRWRDDPEFADANFGSLKNLDYLVCRLKDFHYADDGRAYIYTLERIEQARTSEGLIFRPMAHWEYADDDAADDVETAPVLDVQ